jgi:hypothetical protein
MRVLSFGACAAELCPNRACPKPHVWGSGQGHACLAASPGPLTLHGCAGRHPGGDAPPVGLERRHRDAPPHQPFGTNS